MRYEFLPLEIHANGKTYVLKTEKHDANKSDVFYGYWSCWYIEKGKGKNEFPPQATDGNSCFCLFSIEDSRQKAEEELLERLNSVTKIMTKKDLEEQNKRFDKIFNKKK